MRARGVDLRRQILSAAYELFYRKGFVSVTMDDIADRADTSKKTLYLHFGSKEALAAEVLQHEHLAALVRIQKWSTRSEVTALGYLGALFAEIEDWASEPRWLGSGFTRLTMELSAKPGHPVCHVVHQHKLAFEQWLARELKRVHAQRAESLARQTMVLIEGCLSLALIHADRSYITEAREAAQWLAGKEHP